MPRIERHIQITASELAEFGDALNWALNAYDSEFNAASMVKMSIEQVMSIGMGEDEWSTHWSVAVSGLVEETDDAKKAPAA